MKVAFWKRYGAKLPSVEDLILVSGEMLKIKSDSTKNNILNFKKKRLKHGMLMEIFPPVSSKNKSMTKFVDSTKFKKLEFINTNGSLKPSIDQKKFFMEWNGKINCVEQDDQVLCKFDDINSINEVRKEEEKEKLRFKPVVQKLLKRTSQNREFINLKNIELFTEARTSSDTLNLLSLGMVGGSLAVSTFFPWAIPSTMMLVAGAPMGIGAPMLATIETIERNKKGAFYINGDMRDDKWINKIKIKPEDVKKIEVIQDDSYYFHTNIELNEPKNCKIVEESDILSLVPIRRLEC